MAGGKGGTLHLFTPFEVSDRGGVPESGAKSKFARLRQLSFQFWFSLFVPLAPEQGSFAVPSDIPSGPWVQLRPNGRGGVQGYRWDEGRSGLGQLVALVLVCRCA